MKLILIALLLILAADVDAAARRKCPPGCSHRKAHVCAPERAPARDTLWLAAVEPATTPVPAATPSIGSQILSGFYFGGGFLWEREHECPTLTAGPCPRIEPPGPPRVIDPPYLSAGVRVPLASWVEWDTKFARAFREEPDFWLMTEVQFSPWRKR